MVPMRIIFDKLDCSVEWDENTQTINAKKGLKKLQLTIGKADATIITYTDSTMTKNSVKNVSLDVAPMIINDRTLIPLRFVAESLDCDVSWNEDANTAVICKKGFKNTFENQSIWYEYLNELKVKYQGELKDGLWNGEGKQYYAENCILFEGSYQNGMPNGQGKLYMPKELVSNEFRIGRENILIYDGEWKNGKIDGQGKIYYLNGNIAYEGSLQDNQRHGYGKQYNMDNTLLYDGEWLKNKAQNLTGTYESFSDGIISTEDLQSPILTTFSVLKATQREQKAIDLHKEIFKDDETFKEREEKLVSVLQKSFSYLAIEMVPFYNPYLPNE